MGLPSQEKWYEYLYLAESVMNFTDILRNSSSFPISSIDSHDGNWKLYCVQGEEMNDCTYDSNISFALYDTTGDGDADLASWDVPEGMTPARPILMMPADGLMRSRSFRPMRPRVAPVSGKVTTMKSAWGRTRARSSVLYISSTCRRGRPLRRTPKTRRPKPFAWRAMAAPILPTQTTTSVLCLIGVRNSCFHAV